MSDEKRICPKCNHLNDGEANFCELCGNKLNTDAIKQNKIGKVVCLECGGINLITSNFCFNCGARLNVFVKKDS